LSAAKMLLKVYRVLHTAH